MNVSLETYYLEMEEREIEIIEGQSVFQPTEKHSNVVVVICIRIDEYDRGSECLELKISKKS